MSQKGCLFRDISGTSQKYPSQLFVTFQKYPMKMVSFDFLRVIRISVKIDVGTVTNTQRNKTFSGSST